MCTILTHGRESDRHRAFPFPALIFILATIGFLIGWKALWFLTDDAFIAFRYVSNHQLGYGYVWNAPPFLPVEGYTSFLWVVLLDAVWSVTGVEPPESSNWLACLFGIGSLALTCVMVLKMRLCSQLPSYRNWFLAAVLLGIVTNVTFLVWTSSGLETSLFNFLFVAWVAAALYLEAGSRSWILCLALTGSLLALTRPDGLLIVAVSGALIAAVAIIKRPRQPLTNLVFATPFALPVAHVLWRKSFYGEWLPNTYYAKHVSPWPEAGGRYLLSYVLEYGLWFWALLAMVVLVSWIRRRKPRLEPQKARRIPVVPVPLIIIIAIVAHIGFYTFIVGGDHFEYRVYSHSVPLVLVSTIWMLNRLFEHRRLKRRWAVVIPLLVAALALPIPWTHWAKAQEFTTRRQTYHLTIPLAQSFPPGTRWYVHRFDELQHWLIRGHDICKRHQEHKVFVGYQRARFPRERLMGDEWHDEHRLLPVKTVGVPGWILARAHVIDQMGLNDYVIARNPVPKSRSRRMAHDRKSPQGYVECFKPNLARPKVQVYDLDLDQLAAFGSPGFGIITRESELKPEEIGECELKWRKWISDRQ